MDIDATVFLLVSLMAIVGVIGGWLMRGAWEKFKVDWEAEKEKKRQEEREWQEFEQWKRERA